MRQGVRFVSLAAVVAMSGASLIACGSSGSHDVGKSRVEVIGKPLPEFVAGSEDPTEGTVAPILNGVDFNGTRVRIGGTAGDTRRMVVFLSHWCATCADQAKNLAEWLGKGTVPSNVDVTIVATSTDRSRANYPPSTFLEAAGLGRVPTLVDDDANDAAHAYGITQLPTSVMLLPDNSVLGRLRQDLPSKYFDTLANALSVMPAGMSSTSSTSETTPGPTDTVAETTTLPVEPRTTPTEPPPSGQVTAESLMSMIGRPVTQDELAVLAKACHRSYDFYQDVHCEDTLGFGLSIRDGSVREVYLYNFPPDELFPGALPGGVSWGDTKSDVESALGQPDCVGTEIEYNLHYTSNELDVVYSVEASGYPTARLNEITIHPLADRTATCM